MTQRPNLDVIIPCYNAQKTLLRAVSSALNQANCQKIYLVNDASTDNTQEIIEQLTAAHPDRVIGLTMPTNSGAAMTRNWGALHSKAELIAFLDADDTYQAQALDPIPDAFYFLPNLSLVRLSLQAVDFPDHYTQHPKFHQVWDSLQMTTAGNTIFRRSLFLAAGGFPSEDIFRKFGGEDGALGIALTQVSAVGTLFDQAGVKHFYRPDIHAARLLDAHLFGILDPNISTKDLQQAHAISQGIAQQIQALKTIINEPKTGRKPLILEYSN